MVNPSYQAYGWKCGDLMTAQKCDVIMRAIAQRSDKSIKVTQGEKMQMIKMMTRQVDTSVADYVWLPIRFDGDVAKKGTKMTRR